MAENKKRSIQFRRNISRIEDTRDIVKTRILLNQDEYLDGEQIFGRYYIDETKTKLATLVGLVCVQTKEDGTKDVTITFNDAYANDDDILAISGNSIGDVQIEQITKGNTYQYTDADADYYEVSATTLSGRTQVDSFQLTYTPYSPSGLTVPVTIGDIEKGTKASELNGETLSKVLDDIIFPTIYPDLKNPSASIATSSSYPTIVKGGTAAPSLKVTYTRGTAKVNDGITADRNYTGNLTGATFQYAHTAGVANTNAGVSTSGTTITTGSPTTITSTIASSSITTTVGGSDVATGATTSLKLSTVGTYQFRAIVQYAAGAQMQTSKGDKSNPIRYASLDGKENTTKATVTNPHAASTHTTSYGVTVYVSYPMKANSGSTYSASVVDLPLQKWDAMTIGTNERESTGILFPTTNTTTPIVIKTPRKLKSFNSWNALSSKFDAPQFSNLTTPTEETIDGVKYYVYTWKGSEVSSRRYQIITY